MSELYDYTANDFHPEYEIEIGSLGKQEKSAVDIRKENTFSDIPVGPARLQVMGFAAVEEIMPQVGIDGKQGTLDCLMIRVQFCTAGNKMQRTSDRFYAPNSRTNLAEYFRCASWDEKNGKSKQNHGMEANKFLTFLDAIGFPCERGHEMPEDAKRLGNWINRTCVALIEPGGSRSNGGNYPNQPKLFSYDRDTPGKLEAMLKEHATAPGPGSISAGGKGGKAARESAALQAPQISADADEI